MSAHRFSPSDGCCGKARSAGWRSRWRYICSSLWPCSTAPAWLFYVPPQPPEWIKLRDGKAAGDHYELVSDPASIGARPVLYLSRWGEADRVSPRLAERFSRVVPVAPVSRLRPTRPAEVYNAFWLEGFKG